MPSTRWDGQSPRQPFRQHGAARDGPTPEDRELTLGGILIVALACLDDLPGRVADLEREQPGGLAPGIGYPHRPDRRAAGCARARVRSHTMLHRLPFLVQGARGEELGDLEHPAIFFRALFKDERLDRRRLPGERLARRESTKRPMPLV